MTELTHDQQLWLNLLIIFGFIFAVFAAGQALAPQAKVQKSKTMGRYKQCLFCFRKILYRNESC